MDSKNVFQKYRKNLLLGYALLLMTIVVPIAAAICGLGVLSNWLGLAVFLGSMYFFYKYRFAQCPNCGKYLTNWKSMFFLIGSKCPHCGVELKEISQQD